MNGERAFSQVAASPEQVLGVFRDWQQLEWGRVQVGKEALSFETTVKEWRDDCELLDWRSLGKALNKFFGTDFSESDWQMVMLPEKRRTLRDICSLIATRALLPTLVELPVSGRPCRAASAFFALRSHLRLTGVEVSRIRPSSELDTCLRLHTKAMMGAISKLAPGKVPRLTLKSCRVFDLSGLIYLAGFLALLAGWAWQKPQLAVAGCLATGAGFLGLFAFSRRPPAFARLDGLATFADLSRLIASENTPRDQLAR